MTPERYSYHEGFTDKYYVFEGDDVINPLCRCDNDELNAKLIVFALNKLTGEDRAEFVLRFS